MRCRVYLARIDEGQVWVRAEAVVPQRAAGKRRLVVIGNGVAAMRTLEELLELAPQAYDITVFGAEPHSPYNRVLLSPVLAGEKTDRGDHHRTRPSGSGSRASCCIWAIRWCAIDRRAAPRAFAAGRRSRLRPAADRDRIDAGAVARCRGAILPGVLTFRDLQDVDAMLAGARSARAVRSSSAAACSDLRRPRVCCAGAWT